MSGDITPDQLRFIAADGLTVGRTYFAKDGNLHAGPGDFCPFDHPPRDVAPVNVILEDRIHVLNFPAHVWGAIQAYAGEHIERIRLENSQRDAFARFKKSKLKYHARLPSPGL